MTANNGTTTRRTTRSRAANQDALEDVQARAKRAGDIDPKSKQAAAARKEKVKKDVAEMSIEKATKAVASAKVQITSTLDQLNEEINGKLEELRQVNEAIAIATEELQALHDNDVVLSATADLIDQHEQKKAELKEEIANLRAAWDREQQAHNEAVRERNADLDKSRKREIDDYNFKLDVDRRNERAAFEEEVRQRKLVEVQRREAFEKDFLDRDAALKARETEFVEAVEKAAKFDETSEKLKASYIEMNSIKRDHKVEIEKLTAQHNSVAQLQEQKITYLTQSIADRDRTINALNAELEKARENVKQMATSAMEAQSGKAALEAVQAAVEKVGSKK